MTHSLVTFHSNVGDFASFEEHLLIGHIESDDIEKIIENHLIGEYHEVEEPMQERTIVFAGHKNGDSIIVTIDSIARVSAEEALILQKYIPTMEPKK